MRKVILHFIVFIINFLFLPNISQNQIFSLKNLSHESKSITTDIKTPKNYYIISESIQITQNNNKLSFAIPNAEIGTIISGKTLYNVIYDDTQAELKINLDSFIDPIIIEYNLLNIETKQIENFQEKLIFSNHSNHNISNNKDSTQNKNISSKLTNFLMNMLITQNSIVVLFLIFLLGILMSLTPCIYPMIPITISILGIDKKRTKERFIASILYAFGIAFTFSLLGFLAASGKVMLGNLLSNNIFITATTVILFFMTINMMGMINSLFNINTQIKLPSCIENSQILPFFYGIFSGTITSPCVSPGLFGLLTLVSQQNNIFIGWLWLFIFGLGLASPLILISLLTNTAWQLPGSGSWMNTLKEFLGIILLFILHKNISIITNFLVATIIIFIIFACFLIKKIYTTKTLSLITITAIIFFGILFAIINENNITNTKEKIHLINTHWQTDFDHAINIAKANNKLLLVDFSADWCTICKNVEEALLHKTSFIEKIEKICILCKIDCTKPDEKIKNLLKKYNIKGLPSIFLINPNNGIILEKYHGDILSITEQEVVKKIESLQQQEYNHEK